MSEKQFTLTDWHEVKDNEKIMTVDEVVGKLNEQQDTINQQQFQLDMSQKLIKKLKNDIKMILDMPKEEQQELRCYFHIWCDINE